MKFEMILINKYKYLIHYAEGTSLKNVPVGLEPGKDLIIDFTALININRIQDSLKSVLNDFTLSICEGKARQAKLLQKLAPGKKFTLTNPAALNLAVEEAKQQGVSIVSVSVRDELISTKPNIRSERAYDKSKLKNLRDIVNESLLPNSFFCKADYKSIAVSELQDSIKPV